MSGSFVAVLSAIAIAAGGGGGNVTVTGNTEITGSSGTSLTGSRTSVAASCTVLFLIRWVGSGITISSAPVSGETVNLNASSLATNAANEKCQWLNIDSTASSGTKSMTVTFSGSTTSCGGTIIELAGTLTAGAVGAIATAADAASTVPSMTLTTGTAGSAFFACCMSSGNAGAPVGAGTAAITITSNYEYELCQRLLNAGAAGNKTVAWTSASSYWAISSIEIKSS